MEAEAFRRSALPFIAGITLHRRELAVGANNRHMQCSRTAYFREPRGQREPSRPELSDSAFLRS